MGPLDKPKSDKKCAAVTPKNASKIGRGTDCHTDKRDIVRCPQGNGNGDVEAIRHKGGRGCNEDMSGNWRIGGVMGSRLGSGLDNADEWERQHSVSGCSEISVVSGHPSSTGSSVRTYIPFMHAAHEFAMHRHVHFSDTLLDTVDLKCCACVPWESASAKI